MAEYLKPLNQEDFLSQFDEEPEEYKKGLEQFYAQTGNRRAVRVPFQGGHILYKRNPSIFRKDDSPIVSYYFDNKEAHQKTMEQLNRAQQITNAPVILAPLLSTVVGAKVLAHRRGLGKEGNVRVERFGDEGKVIDLVPTKPKVNTTQPKLKQNLEANYSPKVRFTQADLDAMGIGQPMQYNEGILKSTAKAAVKAKVGKHSKYVNPKDTYYTPFGPYPLKSKINVDSVPKIDTSLNKLVLNKKTTRGTLYKALDTQISRDIDPKHLTYSIDDIIDQGFATQLGLRQGAAKTVADKLPGYIRKRDKLSAIPEETRSAGLSRDPLKGAQKNVKTNFRTLRDLFSLNLLTKDKDIFKINRKGIKNALVTFKVGDKEWHHTFFGNKEGGKLFLNKVAQDPVLAINIMAKLQELKLPTSGVVENLALIEKAEGTAGIGHNKLHNIFRELGLEQGGDLDFSELVDEVAKAYLAGDETAINHFFTLLEVYASRTAPRMVQETKKAGGVMFKDTGVEELSSVQKYKPTSTKFRN
tara:strand:- start:47 stop:1627 length:1581 start_codon:yes stop_codon:yes gene_type:complete